MTDTELVHLEIDSGIATITLDSPRNRNALSTQLRGELRDRLTTATTSDQVRVIVLTHTGTVFCSGMDLKESRGASADNQGVNDFPDTLRLIWNSPPPVIPKLPRRAAAAPGGRRPRGPPRAAGRQLRPGGGPGRPPSLRGKAQAVLGQGLAHRRAGRGTGLARGLAAVPRAHTVRLVAAN